MDVVFFMTAIYKPHKKTPQSYGDLNKRKREHRFMMK